MPGPLERLGADLLDLAPAEFDAWWATLDDADRETVSAALVDPELEMVVGRDPDAAWRDTPATMAFYLSGGRFRLWRYTQLFGRKFKEAVRGVSTRQIWNMPSRMGKSWLASQWGPAWALDDDPSLKLILVSYGDQLARENAMAVRSILREHRGKLNAQLLRDRQRADRFVTPAGGGVLAAGIMSGIIGFGAHGIVFDDPFKNWQEAHSASTRKLVDDQYRSVVSTRLETDDAFVIIPMTRWHSDDLCGRLLQRMEDGTGEAWELVRLPAVAETPNPAATEAWMRLPDPLGRVPGELIEPERFGPKAVAARHLSLGSYLTAGLEQQRPAPEEGGEIKRAWWRIDDNVPARFDNAILSADMKLKERETGDYVVVQHWGRTGKDSWLTDQLRGQWNQPTTENAIALMRVRHPDVRLTVVENTGNGPEVMESLRMAHAGYDVSEDIAGQLGMTDEERRAVSLLRRQGLQAVVPENVKGSKVVRMRAVSGQIEAGDVHLPSHAPWLGTFLDETAAFPNGSYDDQVDACSQALKRLGHARTSSHSPAGRILPPTQIGRGGAARGSAGLPLR